MPTDQMVAYGIFPCLERSPRKIKVEMTEWMQHGEELKEHEGLAAGRLGWPVPCLSKMDTKGGSVTSSLPAPSLLSHPLVFHCIDIY